MAIDTPDPTVLPHVVGRVRALFDLTADPAAITETLRRDASLRPLVKGRPGLRLPGCWDPFEVAVRAVVGQQISVRAATTIMGRIVERAGTRLPGAVPGSLFPSPERLAAANLAGLGLTAARAETLARLAAAVAEGAVRLDGSRDTAVFVEEVTALRGIGTWTAQYVAMRGLGNPDAFPAEDLGLRAAAGRLANGTRGAAGSRVSTRSLLEQAETWRPWRAYAAMHLWNALSAPGEP